MRLRTVHERFAVRASRPVSSNASSAASTASVCSASITRVGEKKLNRGSSTNSRPAECSVVRTAFRLSDSDLRASKEPTITSCFARFDCDRLCHVCSPCLNLETHAFRSGVSFPTKYDRASDGERHTLERFLASAGSGDFENMIRTADVDQTLYSFRDGCCGQIAEVARL